MTAKTTKFGDILKEVSRPEQLKEGKTYKILGVKWYAKGVWVKDIKPGREIKAQRLFKVCEGDLIYNRLFGWKGSFAIITSEFDGCYVSNEFPVFRVAEREAILDFVFIFLSQPKLWEAIERKSQGLTSISRNRLKVQDFLNIEIPLPDLEQQRVIVEDYKRISSLHLQLQVRLSENEKLIGKLRQSVLELAVKGKLVKQTPTDEPTSVLLANIEDNKGRLNEHAIKSLLQSLGKKSNGLPFELPSGWEWVRLGDICRLIGGYAFKSSSYVSDSDNQVIRLGNVKNNAVLLHQNPTFIPDKIAKENEAFLIKEGDILLTMTGTKAKRDFLFTALVSQHHLEKRRLFLNQRVGLLRFYLDEIAQVANVFLKAEALLDQLFSQVTGTANQGNISAAAVGSLPFPLPPLNEQRLIVAKVDELMKLCDALEAKLNQAQTLSESLTASVVNHIFSRAGENTNVSAALPV